MIAGRDDGLSSASQAQEPFEGSDVLSTDSSLKSKRQKTATVAKGKVSDQQKAKVPEKPQQKAKVPEKLPQKVPEKPPKSSAPKGRAKSMPGRPAGKDHPK